MVIGGRSIRSHERQPGDKRQPGGNPGTQGQPREATRGHRVNHGNSGRGYNRQFNGITGGTQVTESPGGHRSPGDTFAGGVRQHDHRGGAASGHTHGNPTGHRGARQPGDTAHGNPGTHTATRGHRGNHGNSGRGYNRLFNRGGVATWSTGGAIVIGGAIKTQHRVRRECQGGRPKNC